MSTTVTASKAFSDSEFGLSEPTLKSLQDMGYEQPTNVQQEAIPLARSGKDLVVQSRTGTGKTAAFGIPVVEKVDDSEAVVQAMVLTPTRELAVQVCEELAKIGAGRGLRVQAIYGGDSIGKQIDGIKAGAQIIVGTPGRVLDLLRRGELKLDRTLSLVLDEADKMLDMGFAQEMSEIMAFVPKERQTCLFSATVPLGIRGLIHNYLNDPTWISLSEDFAYVREVRHTYIIAPTAHKEQVLYKVIEFDQPTSSMIFCNTRNEVRSVSAYLARQGLPVAMISSDLTQAKREQVMNGFRSGKIRHLVATDVAARGIDIDELSHVFIYSTPDSPEDYIHRAGRTGRSGRKGDVVSLVAATDLVSFNRLSNRYELEMIERNIPSDEEIIKRRDERLIVQLVAESKELPPEALAGLEDFVVSLSNHPDATSVFAYLAHRRFAEKPKDASEGPDDAGTGGETQSPRKKTTGQRRRRPRRPRED
jgi:ATP-dependent RNA helicase DeaD